MSYLVQIWGGASDYVLKSVQVMQNQAGKKITGLSWYTPTRVILRKCNWLSVKQLVFYHSVLQIHKTMVNQHPLYILEKIKAEQSSYNTRHQVKFGSHFHGTTDRIQSSFCYRGVISYNKIPLEIAKIENLTTFKKKLEDLGHREHSNGVDVFSFNLYSILPSSFS